MGDIQEIYFVKSMYMESQFNTYKNVWEKRYKYQQ